MDYKIDIQKRALKDIDEGYYWYESKSVGLGMRFVREVETMLIYIEKYPKHYQIKYKKYREGILKIFPFVVIYEIIKEKVVVLSVFPTHGNPKNKM